MQREAKHLIAGSTTPRAPWRATSLALRRRQPRISLAALAIATLLCARTTALAESPKVSIAAAANLVYALDALNAEFKRSSPEVILTATTGASGSLFAQLSHGAPFDVFMSADTDYPKQIVAAGLGDASTLRSFAIGRLVLWTTRTDVDVSDLVGAVRAAAVRKIAIAQPKTAPYGRAAQAVLEKLESWQQVRPKLVFGESISQTAQFIETGNADLGFVAMSLVVSPRLAKRGRWQEVPARLYGDVSLEQALVLTRRGAANPAARQYAEFLGGAAAKQILRKFGYGVP